jgi:hypothetical protein
MNTRIKISTPQYKGQKVKLSLSLIKHQPMKTYSQWRYSSTILDLGTRRRRVVSFTLRPLCSQGKELRCPLVRRLSGHEIRSGRCGVQKISYPFWSLIPAFQSVYERSYPGSSVAQNIPGGIHCRLLSLYAEGGGIKITLQQNTNKY